MSRNSHKLIELEAVRGIAALIVLLHHSLLAFAPRLEGLFFATERFGLFGTPLYAFVNGAAAVILFFVLSGFVLTYRAIEARNTSGIGMAVLKRWPRLAGPVVIVSFISGLFVWWGLYSNTAAAEISRSPWLKLWFATSPYGAQPPLAALYEGLFGTFLYGQAHFNSNLWTMYYEFFGSFIALALALIVIELGRPRLGLLLSTTLFVLTLLTCHFFAPFVAGVIAAQLYSLKGLSRVRLGIWSVSLIGVVIFLLFGFKENPTAYGFYSGLNRASFIPMQQLGVLFHTVAALLIIGLAMAYEPLKRLLSSRAGLWLGQMSFPVYLTHLVVICSVGSYTFTAAKPLLPHSLSIALTLSVVFGVTFIVSYPLAIFDKTWVGFLNKFITDLRREGNRAGAGLTSTLPHQEMNRVRLSRQVLQLNILS